MPQVGSHKSVLLSPTSEPINGATRGYEISSASKDKQPKAPKSPFPDQDANPILAYGNLQSAYKTVGKIIAGLPQNKEGFHGEAEALVNLLKQMIKSAERLTKHTEAQ